MNDRERRIAEEIVRLARDEVGVAPALVGAVQDGEAPLAASLDSLALLSLVVAVEDRFRVILTDDDAAAVRSLHDLARLVAARAGPEASP